MEAANLIYLLETTAKIRREFAEHAKLLNDYPYQSTEEFVLAFGKAYPFRPRPKKMRRGSPQQCFMNALKLADKNPELTYVEGYMLVYLPIMHAWCVDKDGFVIDNTINENDSYTMSGTREYFGIPFDLDFVKQTVLERAVFGVIDNWEQNYPLQSGKIGPEIFLKK